MTWGGSEAVCSSRGSTRFMLNEIKFENNINNNNNNKYFNNELKCVIYILKTSWSFSSFPLLFCSICT